MPPSQSQPPLDTIQGMVERLTFHSDDFGYTIARFKVPICGWVSGWGDGSQAEWRMVSLFGVCSLEDAILGRPEAIPTLEKGDVLAFPLAVF